MCLHRMALEVMYQDQTDVWSTYYKQKQEESLLVSSRWLLYCPHCTLFNASWEETLLFLKREDMKHGRKSLSCEELAADVTPTTTRIMKKVRERWERRISEKGLGKRMLYLYVVYDSGRTRPQTLSPFCMWTRDSKGCIFYWTEIQSAVSERAVKCEAFGKAGYQGHWSIQEDHGTYFSF